LKVISKKQQAPMCTECDKRDFCHMCMKNVLLSSKGETVRRAICDHCIDDIKRNLQLTPTPIPPVPPLPPIIPHIPIPTTPHTSIATTPHTPIPTTPHTPIPTTVSESFNLQNNNNNTLSTINQYLIPRESDILSYLTTIKACDGCKLPFGQTRSLGPSCTKCESGLYCYSCVKNVVFTSKGETEPRVMCIHCIERFKQNKVI
jgi:hypothetical protein